MTRSRRGLRLARSYSARARKVPPPIALRAGISGSGSTLTPGCSGRFAAERLQPAHMLADVGRRLAPVDGVGAGAVPAQAAVGLALQGNLVDQSAAEHVPH